MKNKWKSDCGSIILTEDKMTGNLTGLSEKMVGSLFSKPGVVETLLCNIFLF